jgi:hypothetical protein
MKQFIETDIKNGLVDQLPSPAKKGPHINSTNQCLRAIFEIPFLSEVYNSLEVSKIWAFFEKNEWKSAGVKAYNMHSSPHCLVITSKIGKKRQKEVKIDKAIRSIILDLNCLLEGKEFRKKVRGIVHTHGFILYWTIRALKAYWEELSAKEKETVNKTLNYIENSLYRQLAYYSSEDSAFDIGQLAYYLLTCIEHGKPLSHNIIRKALEVILSNKIEDIPKLTGSFLHSPDGPVMFCMSIEIPTVAARVLVTQGEELIVEFVKHYFPQIENTVKWAELRRGETKGYYGWMSDRHPPGDVIESWASALVLEFFYATLNVIQKCVQQFLLTELNAKSMSAKDWDEIIDYEIGNGQGIKELIKEKIIVPITKDKSKPYSKCGIVLFGPPRTGKNTIACGLALKLGWKTVYITPKDILANGLDNLVRTGDEIFKKLMLLEDVLVFFDEIDILIAPRAEIVGQEPLLIGSFTASMLHWLEDLKKTGKTVFVVCTNYLQKFETAATGRFDLILPVGPPKSAERIKLIKRRCSQLFDDEINQMDGMMDKKMTVGEIEEICNYATTISSNVNRITLLLAEINRVNKRLTIKKDEMDLFEKMISEYQRW